MEHDVYIPYEKRFDLVVKRTEKKTIQYIMWNVILDSLDEFVGFAYGSARTSRAYKSKKIYLIYVLPVIRSRAK